MARLLDHPDVSTADSRQCEHGLYSVTPDGQLKLSKKPTKWASNSQPMLDRLRRRCKGDHEHQWLDGGRTRAAETYPPELVLEILRGIRDNDDHMEHINSVHQPEDETAGDVVNKHALENSGFGNVETSASYIEEFRDRDIVASIASKKSEFKLADGTRIPIICAFNTSYKDEYTS